MTCVAFGRTGLTVSRLCFGTAYLGPLDDRLTPEAGGDLLAHAFELGVTFWDTSDNYGTHPHIAFALRQVPREQVVIASKTYEPEGAVERALRELGTEYLDVMLIHCVGLSWIEPAREALQVLERDKAQGLVRAVGFSTHSAEVARRAAEWPEVEVLLGIVNPTGRWEQGEQIEDGTIADMLGALERAYATGKGVYAMAERAKPLRGCGSPARRALSFQPDGACPERSRRVSLGLPPTAWRSSVSNSCSILPTLLRQGREEMEGGVREIPWSSDSHRW